MTRTIGYLVTGDIKILNTSKITLPLLQIKLALASSLISLGFTSVKAELAQPVITVQSQTFRSTKQLNKPLVFNAPPPPDDIDAPGNRSAGGKRGCENI